MAKYFYVCMYKNASNPGKYSAHAISSDGEFMDSVDEQREKTEQIKEASEKKVSSEFSSFREVFSDFSSSMMGYLEMLPLVAAIGNSISNSVSNGAVKSFVSRHGDLHENNEYKEVYRIHSGHFPTYSNINSKRGNAVRLGKKVPPMLLLGVVSSFEYHFSTLLKCILSNRPEILNSKAIELTLEGISSFGDIESIKSYYISQ
ncbi:hypothetical protein [Devosia sp. FJ2-5-3]|uniref:hypothetical protein n=1 Tax=Devosia sp. FJ2-5-3 TaxID=2976680 RepID=UPI0023D7E706|nr:hypothetical protein [Devosia sp. FJ2-5-3]WEJ59601.1 hypothetical protein N0P34_06135 [Devosia sp. FJ2-5-3]